MPEVFVEIKRASTKRFSQPHELLDRIMSVWDKPFEQKLPESHAKLLAQVAIGVVTAAKLLIRMTNRGCLTCTLPRGLEHTIERASDDLMQNYQKSVEHAWHGMSMTLREVPTVLFGEQAPKPRQARYSGFVRPWTEWRWINPPASLKTPIPQDLAELLDSDVVHGDQIAYEITEILWDSRHKAIDIERELISQYCAAFAAAKWSLTLWGNHSRAAVIEGLAEIASAYIYEQIQTQGRAKAAENPLA
jgi:hypothetical protein